MTRRRSARISGTPASLVWTNRALADLEEIGDFIAKDDPSAARRWIDGLLETAERAAAHPDAGRRVPEVADRRIREVFRHTYGLVYRVTDTGIEVLTVLEGHRRLPRRLWRPDTL